MSYKLYIDITQKILFSLTVAYLLVVLVLSHDERLLFDNAGTLSCSIFKVFLNCLEKRRRYYSPSEIL